MGQRGSNLLSETKIKALRDDGIYADGHGLYLRARGGSRSWVFIYTAKVNGNRKRREMAIGVLPAVTLPTARQIAQKLREAVALGLDPKAERDGAKTFGEVADLYIAENRAGWTNAKHVYQWEQTLGDSYCEAIRAIPVGTLRSHHIIGLIRPIWATRQETARRLIARLERVFTFARQHGWYREPNPARWSDLKEILPSRGKVEKSHYSAMPYGEVPEFYAALGANGSFSARALQFAIVTATRSGEVLGATWREMDLLANTWTIPASRMKAGHEHRVPLSDAALAVLAAIPHGGAEDFVFIGRSSRMGNRTSKPLSAMAMSQIMRRMGKSEFVPHGFRSAFRSWAGEQAFDRELAEMCLAHRIGSAVEQAYRRSDYLARRKVLMDAWGLHISNAAARKKVAHLCG